MNGSVFIIDKDSLYCSNDADFMTERTVIKDDDGKMSHSVHTNVIRVMNFMKVYGNLKKNDVVYCQFKFDENDLVQTFSSIITGVTDEMLIIKLNSLNLQDKNILDTIKNKIKEEINYGS